MKNCPKCNASMPDGVKFCTECGNKMENPQQQESATKFCNSCGAKIPREAKFCPECSAPQIEEHTEKPTYTFTSKEEVLQVISNLSSSEARTIIEQYIVKTDLYQQFEADFIKYKNRTTRMILTNNWEIYLASEINEQINNFVDWFVYCNNLEHKIFLKKSIFAIKVWPTTIAVRIGRSPKEFTDILSNL